MFLHAMIRRRLPALCASALVVSTTLAVSCDPQEGGLLEPGQIPGPSQEIFDGSALGESGFEDVNPHFYFLPPLVKNPTTSGVFDPGVTVEVDVIECGLTDGVGGNAGFVGERRICYNPVDPPVASFRMSGSGDLVQVVDEVYQVDWHTQESNVFRDGTKFYRIVVYYASSGGRYSLGHIDVQFATNGKEIKNINEANPDAIGLNDGRTLPIKFRIEEFATTVARHRQVKVLEADALNEQQLVVWAVDPLTGKEAPAGVVTFTPGSIPDGGLTAVLKYLQPGAPNYPPSPEIPDGFEIPPYLTVELFNEDGTEYGGPDLGGDGARLAWCHDVDDEIVDMSRYAIYKVDDVDGLGRETVVLETGPGADCELLAHALAFQPEKDGSFLDRFRDGLSRVASALTPQPLKAMHGGLNTEGPIRRFSDFGAVELSADASVGPGAVGEPTPITVRLLQGDGGPVGGDAGTLSFVGPSDEPDDDLVVVEVTGGPNAGAEVSDPLFNPADGSYTATYTPEFSGQEPDEITVTVFTRVPQTIILESQLYGHVSCLIEGLIDCDVEPLDPGANEEQQLVVWATDEETGRTERAGVVTFTPGSAPDGVTAVLKYVQPAALNYPPSPEIPDDFEIPPFLTVELFNEDGTEYEGPDLGGDGARLAWCHDVDDESVDMSRYAIYKVDDVVEGSRETVLLETGQGADCELWNLVDAPHPEGDGSFLSRLRGGLSRFASVLTPQPLKAMHGGLNTEGPIRRFSDFGAVELEAYAQVGDGVQGENTEIMIRLLQDLDSSVGGVGGRYVGASQEDGDSLLLVVLNRASGEPGSPLDTLPVSFEVTTGVFSASYIPTAVGTDQITVTVGTRVQQTIHLTSQVAPAEVTINSVSFGTTTLVLGGPAVDYAMNIWNGTGSTIGTDPPLTDRVVVQGILAQGSYEGAAGGSNIDCGGAAVGGELPPGSCTYSQDFFINNPGAFAAGPATARIELRHEGPPGAWETLASYDVPVTLVESAQALPDLTIQSFSFSPALPTSVDVITYTAVVKNIGDGPAGSSTMEIQNGGETFSPTYPIPALAPGEEYTVQRQLVWPGSASYHSKATADFDAVVVESDETNQDWPLTQVVISAQDPSPIFQGTFLEEGTDTYPGWGLCSGVPCGPEVGTWVVNQLAGTALIRNAVGIMRDKPVELSQTATATGGVDVTGLVGGTPPTTGTYVARWSSMVQSAEVPQLAVVALRDSNGALLTSVGYLPGGDLAFAGTTISGFNWSQGIPQTFDVTVDLGSNTASLSIDGTPVTGAQDVAFVQTVVNLGRIGFELGGTSAQTLVWDHIAIF